MLHHYLQLHGNKVHTCNFHADNCVCENKKKKSVLAISCGVHNGGLE